MIKKIIVLLSFAFTLAQANYDVQVKVDENSGILFTFNTSKSGTYIYEHSLKFYIDNLGNSINEYLNFPQAVKHKTDNVFKDDFTILVPLALVSELSDSSSFSILLEVQGCNAQAFCYPPESLRYDFIKISAGNYLINKNTFEVPEDKIDEHFDNDFATFMKERNFFLVLLSFFGYGLMLAFTPCTFPMIPILSSILVAKKDKKNSFLTSLIYVLAMSVTYAFAGLVASIFGASLQALLQTKAVIIVFSLLFVLLALSMFGLYNLELPKSLQNYLDKKSSSKSGNIGIALMGIMSALIVGPCVAAPLAGALIYLAQSADILLGASALFVMSFAMGTPLLLLGLGSTQFLPKPGAWMEKIKVIFGFIMFFMAVWMLSRILNENITLLLYGILGLFFAFEFKSEAEDKFSKIKNPLFYLILLYSSLLIIGFTLGAKNISKPLLPLSQENYLLENDFQKVKTLRELKEIISESSKPVIVDFWAAWCSNCKEIDEEIFQNANIVSALKAFKLVKIDLTNIDKEDKEIMKEFSIFGPPAILFFKDKKELKDKRIVGLIDSYKFLSLLETL